MSRTRIQWRHGSNLAVALALWGGAWSTLAQQAAPAEFALSGKVVEVFTREVKTSSHQSIIGAVLGKAPDHIALGQLRALVPPSSGPFNMCFSATTSDGVYSATGELQAVKATGAPMAIRPTDFFKYDKQLAEYGGALFTGRLTSGVDCNAPPSAVAVIHPLLMADQRNLLTVSIASHGAQISAKLRWPKEKKQGDLDGVCEPLTGRNVAFDARCVFQFDESLARGSDSTLVLQQLPKSGPPRTELYKIRVAP